MLSPVTDAGLLHCPSCGAPVAEGVRRCTHCEAPVATVRCAHCLHMNVADALHCTGCGRDLGLEPIARDGPLLCPDCRVPMAVLDCGPAALHDCGTCGGQFVEHEAMRDLVERHDRLDVGARKRLAPARADTRVRYVACPACGSMMNRQNFGAMSGVIVDVCSKHGTWFDPGELPRVLSFVESGGLTRARQRHEEDVARKEREQRVQAATSQSTGGMGDSVKSDAAMTGGSLLADLIAALFG